MVRTVPKYLPFLLYVFPIFRHVVSSTSLDHSFLWLTQTNKLVNCNTLRNLAPSSGPPIVLPLCIYLVLLVTSLLLCQKYRCQKWDLNVYFYLLAESISWIIKVLSSLFETPKRKEITRTDLGIERKWDKECNHNTSEWFSDWHLYIKNM